MFSIIYFLPLPLGSAILHRISVWSLWKIEENCIDFHEYRWESTDQRDNLFSYGLFIRTLPLILCYLIRKRSVNSFRHSSMILIFMFTISLAKATLELHPMVIEIPFIMVSSNGFMNVREEIVVASGRITSEREKRFPCSSYSRDSADDIAVLMNISTAFLPPQPHRRIEFRLI